MIEPNTEFLFTRQRHEADRMGLHYDYRFVVGDKAYSFATKKEMPEPGKMIVLFEQPVHDREYALSPKVVIPKGNYGAGTTFLEYVHKAKIEEDSKPDYLKFRTSAGHRFLLKKLPGDQFKGKGWLFRNLSKPEEVNKYMEKVAEFMYVRRPYKEASFEHLKNPVGSPKRDGAHYVWTIGSTPEQDTFHSRRLGVNGTHPEKAAVVPHLKGAPPEYAKLKFAVELVHTGHTPTGRDRHNLLSGILNSKPERASETQKQIGPVRAVVLDVLNKPFDSYKEKQEFIEKFTKDVNKPGLVEPLELAFGFDAIEKLRQKVKHAKGEGLIVTEAHGPEGLLYKEKNFQTYNLKISKVLQEYDKNGAPKEMAGAFAVIDASGKEVAQAGGMTRALKIDAWKNPKKYVGQMIQVRAFPPSKEGGRLRHPLYNGEPDGEWDRVE